MINLNFGDDIFYRYKREKCILTHDKNYTIIENFNKICQQLQRSPKILDIFLKNKLNKTTFFKNSKLYIQKYSSEQEIENILTEFTKIFIICKKCENPETLLLVKCKKHEENILYLKCNACSYDSVIKEQDNTICKIFLQVKKENNSNF